MRFAVVAVMTFVATVAGCPTPPADTGNPDPPKTIGLGATCAAATDCGGQTPLCTGGFCVQCDGQTTSTCGNNQVCSSSGLCGQCATNTDCPTAEPLCRPDGACAECLTAGDCGAAAPSCHPKGVCVASCGSGVACGAGLICSPTALACVQCLQSTDCTEPGKPICGADASCHECGTNDDCGVASPFCVEGRCHECLQNTDCGAAGQCNADLSCIVPECTTDAQCGDQGRPVCIQGTCEQCRVNADCTNGQRAFCEVNQSRCVECLVDGDCPAQGGQPQQCQQNQCQGG